MPRCRGLVMLAGDQIAADGSEIVERPLPLGFQRRLVPVRTVFAAAADIGDDVRAAAFQPELAQQAVIARRRGRLETAVRVQDRRRGAVVLHIGGVHDEVRDLRTVG